MKEVPLTRGLVALVDDEDFELVSRFKWHADFNKRRVYARTNIYGPDKTTRPRMHQMIAGAGSDHRDGNGLDNRRSNLRTATNQENSFNRRCKKLGATSKFKGVSWSTARKKWCVNIEHSGRNFFLGRHETEEAAARAYDLKAKELFGKFAVLNFP